MGWLLTASCSCCVLLPISELLLKLGSEEVEPQSFDWALRLRELDVPGGEPASRMGWDAVVQPCVDGLIPALPQSSFGGSGNGSVGGHCWLNSGDRCLRWLRWVTGELSESLWLIHMGWACVPKHPARASP